MQKPTGKSTAPSSGSPVLTEIVTAKAAARARIAPAMKDRMSASRVDMNTLDSPASMIRTASSAGLTYDMG